VPDHALSLLHRKLSDARFPDEVDDAGWDYGVPLSDVKLRFTPPGSKGACRNIFLSKGNGAVAESVCLSFCALVVDLG